MKNGKKCWCLLAVIAAVVAILLITYIFGYSLGSWTFSTWLAAMVIVIVAFICMRCRLKEDEAD